MAQAGSTDSTPDRSQTIAATCSTEQCLADLRRAGHVEPAGQGKDDATVPFQPLDLHGAALREWVPAPSRE
jgi:hypothetical protein